MEAAEKRATVRFPASLRRQLRMAAADLDLDMEEIIGEAFIQWQARYAAGQRVPGEFLRELTEAGGKSLAESVKRLVEVAGGDRVAILLDAVSEILATTNNDNEQQNSRDPLPKLPHRLSAQSGEEAEDKRRVGEKLPAKRGGNTARAS